MPASRPRRRFRALHLERLEDRLALDASQLRITEFVASNDNGLTDYDGASSDWVELYNSGTTSVALTGLYLTDSSNNLQKWAFPAGQSIGPGGYKVVFASGKNTVKPNGEVHTSYSLSAGGEYLGLIAADGTTVIDHYTPSFPVQVEDVSYGVEMAATGATTTLVAQGAAGRAWRPTSSIYDTTWTQRTFNDAVFNIVGPASYGYESAPGDAVNFTGQFATTVATGITSLYSRIAFNLTTLAGIDQLTLRMKYDDGFVAYLNGQQIAEGNAPDEVQWNSRASSARADSAAIVYADFNVSAFIPQLVVGTNVLAIHGLNTSNTSPDFLIVPQLVAGSKAIFSPTDRGYFDLPTPGFGNGVNFAGFVENPTISVPHGFYNSAQSVSLSTATPGAIIVYTINGSTPNVNASLQVTNGTLYTGPLNISATTTLRARAFKTDFRGSFVEARTYLFLDDVLNQSPQGQTPAGFAANGLNGQVMDYGIDPEILALYGAPAVKTALLSLPSISITTDLANLFNGTTGIYVNAQNRGPDWERPASVELLNPDGTPGFDVNAGLRIRGGYSRNDFNPKHAFRLYFRSEYGDSKLNYPLFGAEGTDTFDVLDLRAEQNYSWSSEGNIQNSFLREVFARDTQADMGEQYTRSRYYHLYLDGQYWGIFMTQERVEEFFAETYFGGNEEDYDVVKADLAVSGETEVSAGNDLAWRQLFNLAQGLSTNFAANQNNYWTMQGLNTDGTRNTSLPVLLDVKNLVDYMSIIFFTGGYDTGLSRFLADNEANNWFGVYNRVSADQGFQFFMHDNEHSLGAEANVHGTLGIDRTGPFNNGNQGAVEQFNPAYLHQDLLAHPEYRQAWIDRTQQLYGRGGVLTSSANIARLLERKVQVDPAVIAEAARWGDSKVTVPRNKATWQTEVDWLVNTYFPQRGGIVLNQLRADGLSTTFGPPEFSQNGGAVPWEYQLGLTSTATGTIYYTTDGVTDPRAIGGAVNSSPDVQMYTGTIPLTQNVVVRARLLTTGGQWSALVQESFTVAPRPGDYDRDGSVTAADGVFWANAFGATTGTGLQADGNGNGEVDAADFTVWRDNYTPLPASVSVASAAVSASAYSAPASQAPRVSGGSSAPLRFLTGAARTEELILAREAAFAEIGAECESDVTPNRAQRKAENRSGAKATRGGWVGVGRSLD